jgi:hypothetical protein
MPRNSVRRWDNLSRAPKRQPLHTRTGRHGVEVALAQTLSPIDPAAERRDWRRLFAKAAAQYAQRGVPQALAEQAMALGREIDTLE